MARLPLRKLRARLRRLQFVEQLKAGVEPRHARHTDPGLRRTRGIG
jgi:hypothetical protein